MRRYDPEHVTHVINEHVGTIAYQLRHANGLLDRIDVEIAAGVRPDKVTLAAIYLDNAAHTLRSLADLCEERHKAITAGVATFEVKP